MKKAAKQTGKQAEIARRTGKSRVLMTRKAKQGKLVVKNGEIDVEASVAAIKAAELPKMGSAPVKDGPEELEKRVFDGIEQSGETYAEAQRRKEIALANLRELELAQKSGEVVSLAFATGFLTEASKTVTNLLLGLPDVLAPLMASISDVRECRDLILKELRQVLSNLPSEIPVPKTE